MTQFPDADKVNVFGSFKIIFYCLELNRHIIFIVLLNLIIVYSALNNY